MGITMISISKTNLSSVCETRNKLVELVNDIRGDPVDIKVIVSVENGSVV